MSDEETANIGAVLEDLRQLAKEQGESPTPLMQGTFAMYAMPDGGVMMVSSVPEGPMAGEHRHRIPPALIRSAASLLNGGNPFRAIGGMFKGRKAISGG